LNSSSRVPAARRAAGVSPAASGSPAGLAEESSAAVGAALVAICERAGVCDGVGSSVMQP
jgi:hypothetical protein